MTAANQIISQDFKTSWCKPNEQDKKLYYKKMTSTDFHPLFTSLFLLIHPNTNPVMCHYQRKLATSYMCFRNQSLKTHNPHIACVRSTLRSTHTLSCHALTHTAVPEQMVCTTSGSHPETERHRKQYEGEGRDYPCHPILSNPKQHMVCCHSAEESLTTDPGNMNISTNIAGTLHPVLL